jgi:hypothetical protein
MKEQHDQITFAVIRVTLRPSAELATIKSVSAIDLR